MEKWKGTPISLFKNGKKRNGIFKYNVGTVANIKNGLPHGRMYIVQALKMDNIFTLRMFYFKRKQYGQEIGYKNNGDIF